MVSDCPLTSAAGQDHGPELPLLLDLSQDPFVEARLLRWRRGEAALCDLTRRGGKSPKLINTYEKVDERENYNWSLTQEDPGGHVAHCSYSGSA